jgi:hypothetical protein
LDVHSFPTRRSSDLNSKLQKDNRNMLPEEAYRQLGHSASLFKAVLISLK